MILKIMEGFESYSIDEFGNIYNKRNKKMKVSISKNWIKWIQLSNNGLIQNLSVRKLIAQNFLKEKSYDIPGNKLLFLDGDMLNTHYTNLKWVPDRKNNLSFMINGKTYNPGMRVENFGLLKVKNFKIIKSNKKYYINEKGVIVNWKGIVLTPEITEYGYYRIRLGNKKFFVHRLVAENFIKPYSYNNFDKVINHKDGDKLNNHYSNLEWVTIKENVNHAHDTGLVNKNIRIILKDLKNGKKRIFRSLREFEKVFKKRFIWLTHLFRVSEHCPIYDRFLFKIENYSKLLTENDVKIIINVNGTNKKFDTLYKASMYTGISYRDLLCLTKRNISKLGPALIYNGKEIKLSNMNKIKEYFKKYKEKIETKLNNEDIVRACENTFQDE